MNVLGEAEVVIDLDQISALADSSYWNPALRTIGTLVFLPQAFNRTKNAFDRVGRAQFAKSKGFTEETVDRINSLSQFYLLFLYTEVVISVYGLAPGPFNKYLDLAAVVTFAFLLTTARSDAISDLRARWPKDREKMRYLKQTLSKFGGSDLEVVRALSASLLLLAGSYAREILNLVNT